MWGKKWPSQRANSQLALIRQTMGNKSKWRVPKSIGEIVNLRDFLPDFLCDLAISSNSRRGIWLLDQKKGWSRNIGHSGNRKVSNTGQLCTVCCIVSPYSLKWWQIYASSFKHWGYYFDQVCKHVLHSSNVLFNGNITVALLKFLSI